MPSDITSWGAGVALATFIGRTVTPPNSFYLALVNQMPDTEADGTTIQEPVASGNGYARVQIANDTTIWGDAQNSGVVANVTNIIYSVCQIDWGVIIGYALCDAATAGNVYLYGTWRVPRFVETGQQVIVQPGYLTMSVTGIKPQIQTVSVV